ncbi:MAG TPA: RNA degradosome polyphosphate kinase, partial [Gammaproteobacteria bacterium]|nr:RNA degradosome polyphosphate kinase [Gammaproteobacteria bacterium]
GKKIHPKLLIHAPFNLRKSTIKMIELEADAARAGKPSRIIAKLNSLTDVAVIKALFSASIAGVQIDLIIRGICCLKPGLPGVSENIRVISVVGRFLEHSRVYYFQNSQPQLYCSSADWMERNLSHRIEVCFPILKKKHSSRILSDLEAYLDDEVQSWEMRADGHYERLTPQGSSQPGVQTLLLKKLTSS